MANDKKAAAAKPAEIDSETEDVVQPEVSSDWVAPNNIIVTHTCRGAVIVFGDDDDSVAIKEYIRMVRAGVMMVDASPLIENEQAKVDGVVVHVEQVSWYHDNLAIRSIHFNCSH